MIGEEVKGGGPQPPAEHVGLVSHPEGGGFYSEWHEDPLQVCELMSDIV